MRVRVFRSDKGDCLLLQSKSGKTVLVDGGMASSFRDHVQPALAALKPARLDLVYVSHIDSDHIGGVLELFRWRASLAKKFPLAITDLWHNGFPHRAAVTYSALEKSADILDGGSHARVREMGRELRAVAYSVREAVELQAHASASVRLNRPTGGGLMLVPRKGAGKLVPLGSLRLQVIGPFEADLAKLKSEWNAWLKKNKKKVDEIEKTVRPFSAGGSSTKALNAKNAQRLYDALVPNVAFAATKLGRRAAVTTPNLASLMLLVKEGGTSLLLTGDGHCEDLLRGLEACGALKPKGKLHVTVLKVQHHGSKNNIDQAFCDRVSADHYLFCGNGKHQNPHLKVVELVAGSRAKSPGAFKFWFNSNSKAPDAVAAHMRKLEKLMTTLKARYPQLSHEFLKGSSFELTEDHSRASALIPRISATRT